VTAPEKRYLSIEEGPLPSGFSTTRLSYMDSPDGGSQRWWGRLVKGIVALVLLLAVLDFNYPLDTPLGDEFDKGENAVWLGGEWSDTLHTPEARRELANSLARRGVRWIFAGQGELRSNGSLPKENSLYAGGLVADVHRAQTNIRILGWISGHNGGRGGLDLSDPAVRARIVQECRYLVDQLDFDGIHLNIEPAPSGDPNYLALLDEIRTVIGSRTLSVAAMKPTFFAINIGPFNPFPYSWDGEYYEQVARRVDQLTVMTYDSGLPFANLYIKYAAWQTQQALDAIRNYPDCELLVGVPTYEELSVWHYPRAENAGSGLQGAIEGLREMRRNGLLPSNIRGVALFADWTTSPQEWETYEQLWRGD
jgi:hypothetical protein